jgi:hypothetical protein
MLISNEDQWQIGIEGALSANFFQPDGTSRPGTDWSVGLKNGNQEKQHVTVRSYLSADMTRRARKDTGYQAQTVMGYVSDLLAQGWTPSQGEQLEITIQNPTGEPAKQKSWWKVW